MEQAGSVPAFDADTIAVRNVLGDLPQAEREVLVLRFYADLKVDDIARENSGSHRARSSHTFTAA